MKKSAIHLCRVPLAVVVVLVLAVSSLTLCPRTLIKEYAASLRVSHFCRLPHRTLLPIHIPWSATDRMHFVLMLCLLLCLCFCPSAVTTEPLGAIFHSRQKKRKEQKMVQCRHLLRESERACLMPTKCRHHGARQQRTHNSFSIFTRNCNSDGGGCSGKKSAFSSFGGSITHWP